jgi:glutamyl-tRNA reductase
LTRFRDREERERYMDSLERQMEHEREQIQRTLDRTTGDSDRRQKALEKLLSALPSVPVATPCEALRNARGSQSRSEAKHPQPSRKVPGSPPSRGPGGGGACWAAHKWDH